MTATTSSPTSPFKLCWPLSDEQFVQLCELNPDVHFEYTSAGELVMMTRTGG